MSRALTFICIALSCLVLTGTYVSGHELVGAGITACMGLAWLWANGMRWRWSSPLGLLAAVGSVAAGLWLKLPAPGLLVGSATALLAWDLVDFTHRLEHALPGDDQQTLEHSHLRWVFMLVAGGLALSGLAMLIQLHISFGWTFFFSLVTVIGIWRISAWLDNKEEPE